LGIILYVFGTGPIQGFATTLIIGILTSLFAAIFITRLVFETMMRKDKPIAFDTAMTRGAFKNIKIDFVAKRKLYYTISGLIVLAGIVSMATRGLNLGVDFKGGRTYVVRFEKEMEAQDVRSALVGAFGTAPEVKTFGPSNQFKVTTPYLIDDVSVDADHKAEQKLKEGLSTIQGNAFELMSSQKVGKTVSDDIQSSAVWAILLSMIVMFIYILIRFKKWQYSLGSVVALLHDVMAILACYSIFYGLLPFSLEIDQGFIAAILTVMGYSMNDTVVVFDRIREYISHNPNKDLKTTINSALNSTLSRTINTSLTIFFVLLAIFIFGGEVIRGFSFALLIGIIVGTYSSICIATPIVIDFYGKQEEDKKQ
jgi:SecD/SecF fusion protein